MHTNNKKAPTDFKFTGTTFYNQCKLFYLGDPVAKHHPYGLPAQRTIKSVRIKKHNGRKLKMLNVSKQQSWVSRHWRQKIHNQNGIGSLTHPMLIHSIIVQGPLFRDQLDRFKRLMYRDHCSGTIVEKLTTIP